MVDGFSLYTSFLYSPIDFMYTFNIFHFFAVLLARLPAYLSIYLSISVCTLSIYLSIYPIFIIYLPALIDSKKGCPRDVMVKTMDCGIVVSEFELQSRYYVHPYPPSYGLNSTTTVLLGECFGIK